MTKKTASNFLKQPLVASKWSKYQMIKQPLNILDSASFESSFIKIKGTFKIDLFLKNGLVTASILSKPLKLLYSLKFRLILHLLIPTPHSMTKETLKNGL